MLLSRTAGLRPALLNFKVTAAGAVRTWHESRQRHRSSGTGTPACAPFLTAILLNQAPARNRNFAPDIIRFRISTYLAHPNE